MMNRGRLPTNSCLPVIGVHMCVCVRLCVYMCVYVYAYVCVCLCVYVCVCA